MKKNLSILGLICCTAVIVGGLVGCSKGGDAAIEAPTVTGAAAPAGGGMAENKKSSNVMDTSVTPAPDGQKTGTEGGRK